MEKADLPTIVKGYLKKRFPDAVGVTHGNWIFVWENYRYPRTLMQNVNSGCSYIAQIMDAHVVPFWNPSQNNFDAVINAADPNFFENLEKFVKYHLKEEHNG